ncbi:MAG: hypothetical protein BWY83_02754 [bacterium ADurb.Bin478]|nr:MAG: hypothetical protein BWY83_02754 [bacterium ADurb.Bin478]
MMDHSIGRKTELFEIGEWPSGLIDWELKCTAGSPQHH